MRLFMIGLAALVIPAVSPAQVLVHGYTTKNGTYVAPHYRSSPDGNPYNNWSTRGNVNPYTGQAGTKNPYSSYGSSGSSYGSYGSGNSYGSSSNKSDDSNTETCVTYSPC